MVGVPGDQRPCGRPEVDADLLAMSRPDGTAEPRAVLRFLVKHPLRIPKLIRLAAA